MLSNGLKRYISCINIIMLQLWRHSNSLVPRPLFPFLFVVAEKRIRWISVGTFVLLDLQILRVINKCWLLQRPLYQRPWTKAPTEIHQTLFLPPQIKMEKSGLGTRLAFILLYIIASYIGKYNTKQKHLGCKKRRGQSEAAVIWLWVATSIVATKSFDIS